MKAHIIMESSTMETKYCYYCGNQVWFTHSFYTRLATNFGRPGYSSEKNSSNHDP